MAFLGAIELLSYIYINLSYVYGCFCLFDYHLSPSPYNLLLAGSLSLITFVFFVFAILYMLLILSLPLVQRVSVLIIL